MGGLYPVLILSVFCLGGSLGACCAKHTPALSGAHLDILDGQEEAFQEIDPGFKDLPEEAEGDEDLVADPLEPINRAFFHFNDKMYFWVLKPVARGYKKVVPQSLRISIRNFFSNLSMPPRAVNCLIQGKVKGFGTEVLRFLLNSTLGVLGFGDPAKKTFNIDKQNEDLGQTLGSLGLSPGIYINWPFLGPSSLRDTVGLVGDAFLNPLNYILDTAKYNIGVRGYDQVNKTSLSIGEYESLKKAALDPYISLRDAYHQYRLEKVKE